MSQYYDPWIHAIEIFFRRVLQFIFLTLILTGLMWCAWLHFYFDAEIWTNTKKAVMGEARANKAFLLVCLACSFLITGWLFSWLMRDARQSGENYHRGVRIQKDQSNYQRK